MDAKRRIIGEEPEQVKIDHEVQSEKGCYSARELYEMNIKELPMLVNPIFLKSGLSVFAGSSDTGKSTFLRQLGLAIAKGNDTFLGWEIKAEHNRVIYVSTEDDRIAISYLLNKSLGDNADVEYLDNFTYIFNTSGLVDNLDAILSKKPADCVIIDALTDIYGGELNQSNRVREFLNQFFTLVDKHNCLFIFIHHTGKRTEEYPPNKNNLLGSQGIEGKARQVIELRRDPKDNQFRHLCLIKGNYIADELKTKSFKMKFNEDLTYEMTDERVDFEELIFSQMDRNEYKREVAEKVIELRDSGNTFENISRLLADEGINISKSTAFNYYKKFKS